MRIDQLCSWMFALAWAVVLGFIVFDALPRMVREGTRIVKRVLAIVNDSTLSDEIANAQGDLVRMQAALDRLPGLVRRTQAAVTLVRATPLVPPSIVDAVGRVRRELRAFRADSP